MSNPNLLQGVQTPEGVYRLTDEGLASAYGYYSDRIANIAARTGKSAEEVAPLFDGWLTSQGLAVLTPYDLEGISQRPEAGTGPIIAEVVMPRVVELYDFSHRPKGK
jgi:hypothetical protein